MSEVNKCPGESDSSAVHTRSALDLLGGIDQEPQLDESSSTNKSRSRAIVARPGSGSPPRSGRRPGSPPASANAILTPRRRANRNITSVRASYGELPVDNVDTAWCSPRPGGALSSARRSKDRSPGNSNNATEVMREQRLKALLQHDLTDTDVCNEKKLLEYFELFDAGATRNGYISREEFKSAYRAFENFGRTPSEREIDELFERVDMSQDGRLSFDEFCLLMAHRAKF